MCYVGSFKKKKKKKRERKKILFFQTKWHRLPGDRLTGLMHITISLDVMNSEWHSAIPLSKTAWTPLFVVIWGVRSQAAFKVQQRASSRAEGEALRTMISVLPKPPPFPSLCPHSQSKMINLYYRLQSGAVNMLLLGPAHSIGIYLNGCMSCHI